MSEELQQLERAMADPAPKPDQYDLDDFIKDNEDEVDNKSETKNTKQEYKEEDKPKKERKEYNYKTSAQEKEEKDKEDKKKGPRYWTKEEWEKAGKDPAKYKSKEQFEADGQFFKKIEEQNKIIKKLEARLYQEDKARFDNYKNHLETQRFQAMAQADPYTAYQLEQQLNQLQEPEAPVYDEPEEASDYQLRVLDADKDFEERNKSWLTDKSFEAEEMREYAKELAFRKADLIRNHQIDPEEMIELIEQELKRQYPHRFQEVDEDEGDDTSEKLDAIREELADLKETKKYPPVESNSYSKSKVTARDIPREYRDIYLSMPEEERKAMPPAKYIKKLKEYGVA